VFSSADANLYLLDLNTSQVRRLTSSDDSESRPRFSPDGKQIVYASRKKESATSFLFVRSLDGKLVRQLTDASGVSDSMPAYSSDGSRLVFARAHRYRGTSMGGSTWDDWDAYVMKSDGTELERITHQKYFRGLTSPAFLPGGTKIIYSAQPFRDSGGLADAIFEVEATGDHLLKSLATDFPMGVQIGAWAHEPGISKDGSLITFISDRVEPFHYDVFIMRRDGTNPTPLNATTVSWANRLPRFLPNGKSILFLAETPRQAPQRDLSLWQIDIDGKNLHEIADSTLFIDPLRWKPKQ
jgi:Tol biopolymer transport system component